MLSKYEAFAAAISAVYRNIQKIERDEMTLCGGKGAFAHYLTVLYRHPEGLTAAEMCDICDKDKAAISRVVAELEERGLVLRTDGSAYRAHICLSEEGRATAEYVLQRAQAAVDTCGQGLTDAERSVFYAVLNHIAGNLETIARDGLPPHDHAQKENSP